MKALGILLGIVVIIGAAYLMVTTIIAPRRSVDLASFTRTAHYLCAGGKTFSIALGEDDKTATVVFRDGRTFELDLTKKSSGSRYANTADEVVLWVQGKTAYAEEVGKRTHTDCTLQDDVASRDASAPADPQRAVAW